MRPDFKINGHAVAFGSVSHGTLRTEDLMREFSDEIRRLSLRTPDICFEADSWLSGKEGYIRDGFIPLYTIDDPYEECGSQIVNELQDHLDNMAPEGVYFGNTEGDGSDFGWWSTEDEDDGM